MACLRLHNYFKEPILLLFRVNDLLILKFKVLYEHLPVYSSLSKGLQVTFKIISDHYSVRMRSPRVVKVTLILN